MMYTRRVVWDQIQDIQVQAGVAYITRHTNTKTCFTFYQNGKIF